MTISTSENNKENLVSLEDNPFSRAGSGKSSASSRSALSSSRPQTAISHHSRISDTSILSLGPQLIHPWEFVKEIIAKNIGPKIVASLPPLIGDPSAIFTAEDAKFNSPTPITLSHGFQPISKMENAKNGIKQVCYLPNSSIFASLDRESIQMWKSGLKIKKIPILPSLVKNTSKFVDGFIGVTKWIYIDIYRLYLIANQQLELKILNANFEVLSVALAAKPILYIEFCEKTKSIHCGGIGGITIYNIKKADVSHANIYILEEQLRIEKDMQDDWVSFIYYEQKKRCIYVSSGLGVYVFDYETGQKIDSYNNIHELSITCLSFYEPAEYLITGAKDGTIKVWNIRKSLLFDFHDHYNAITSFLIVEEICGAKWGSLPLILSSSLDGTIRMWNIETGQALYRVETSSPCLGLAMIKKNIFYHFTETTIQLWNFNRFYHTFAVLLSKAIILKKYHVRGRKSARLLAASPDGSIQLLSILSGTNLGTGFPTKRELTLSQIEYDVDNEIIYVLNTNGTITVYNSCVNPFQITQLWNNSKTVNKETIQCICGADFYHYEYGSSKEIDERLYQRGELAAGYVLFGGTDSGQIHQICFEEEKEKSVAIIQAHANKITMLYFDIKKVRLISGAHDRLIKIWNISLNLKISNSIMNSSERLLDIRLKCIYVINLDSLDSLPSYSYAICPETEQLGIHSRGELFLATYDKTQTLQAQKDFHESAKIIQIVTTSSANLWAASYGDFSVKVWDSKGVLIRDIQFNEQVTCICFANERGDLLVGLANEIKLVRMQDYMPLHFLRQMYQLDFQDDIDDIPMMFNQQVDIWDYQKEKKVETEIVHQQLKDKKQDILHMDYEQLLELSNKRREEASKRRKKREFINIEKHIYLKDMEKRAKKLHEKANSLLYKDQLELDDNMIVQDLDDIDESKIPVKPNIEAFIDPSAVKKDRKYTEPGKMKQYMGRFRKKNVDKATKILQSAEIIEPTIDDLKPSPLKPKYKKKMIKSDFSLFDIQENSDSDSSINLASLDSMVMDEPIYSEEVPAYPRHNFITNFFGEDIEKNEVHHKELIAASANELKLIIETHEKEQMIKLMKVQAKELMYQDPNNEYKPGMLLPNSSKISSVLPLKKDGKTIVKSEKIFQKDQLEELYVNRAGASSAPPVSKPKKKLKSTKKHVRAKSEPPPSPKIVYVPQAPVEPEIIKEEVAFEEEEVIPAEDLVAVLEPTPPMRPKTPEIAPIEEKVKEEPIIDPLPSPIIPLPSPKIPLPSTEILSPAPRIEPVLPVLKREASSEWEIQKIAEPSPLTDIPPPLEIVFTNSAFQDYPTEPGLKNDSVIDTSLLSGDATKKLIELHGMENRQRKKSKKDKKDKEGSGGHESVGILLNQGVKEEIVFDPSKYIKPVTAPTPIVKPKPKRMIPNPGMKSKRIMDNMLSLNMLEEKRPRPETTPKRKQFELKHSFPKGHQFAHNIGVEENNLVRPIIELLFNVNVPLDKNITITNISKIVQDQLKLRDTKKIMDALDALVSLYSMFGNDIHPDNRFDTFVAPLIDSFSSEEEIVRKKILASLVDMGIRHDSILSLLICALNEPDKTVVQLAIKGLANYGIADKEGLRRAMVELGMIKGITNYTNNRNIDQLAFKLKKEFEKQVQDKNRVVAAWVHQTPTTPPGIKRTDSYMDTLAGPFFPPDAHDFNGKQRALAMQAEANQGYDQYWKKKFMEQFVKGNDEPFFWNFPVTNGRKDNNLQLPTPNISNNNSRANTSKKPKIKGSPAQFAIIMSRALGHGGLPPNIVFPKIKNIDRPQTVNVPTVLVKRPLNRPFTTVGCDLGAQRSPIFQL